MNESCVSPDDEQVIDEAYSESSISNLSEEKQKAVLIKYIQEKRDLQEQLDTKEKEVQEYKAKVYDLTNQLEQTKKSGTKLSGKSGPRTPQVGRKSGKKTKKSKKKKDTLALVKQDSVDTKCSDSIDIDENEGAASDLQRYKDIAKRFPELKFSVILESEKIFWEADTNGDGTIDETELEKVLEKQGHYMTTKKEVKQIMTDIDKDATGTIDLMEYMAVLERVQMRKRTNLPPQLTKSTTCAIQ